MEKKNLRKLSPKEELSIQKEFEKPIDWSKAMRKGIYINLSPDVIAYFKGLSEETGRGYQTLIQEALHYFKEKKLKPKTVWKADSSE